MSQTESFILRITEDEWVNQVFDLAIYYTNMNRKWKQGQRVFFLHKLKAGDAIVGYGVISTVFEKEDLPDEEKKQCELGKWRKAIEFRYVKRFEHPPLARETLLRNSRFKGRCFQGLRLDEGEIDAILARGQ